MAEATGVAAAAFPRPVVTRLWARFAVIGLVAVAAVVGLLAYDIPMDPSRRGFWLAVQLRIETVATIAVVATCQAVATVLFHTATANRILTPSVMGFDALYVVMQTAVLFSLGSATFVAIDGLAGIAVQSLLMIGFATLVYGWLFAGRRGDLHTMLLIGIVLGVAFASLSTVMQRLLTPSEFDLLSARLFGNLSNSEPEYLPWAALIIAVVLVGVARGRHRLDVLALGREQATNLGLSYKREVLLMLMVVAVLISISTTMVGPLTFFGFIVATLAYQLAGSSNHRVVLPFAVLLGMVVLLVGYFTLRHVFYAAGMLSVIIEFAGGMAFLVHLLRRGTL